MKLLWTVAVLALLSSGAVAQQPRTASIDGVVVERENGGPIARASVELRQVADTGPGGDERTALMLSGLPQASGGTAGVSSGSKVVTTTTDGRFTFSNVAPGRYRLYSTRSTGYVPGEYGQRGATGEGTPFRVDAGQRMTGVTLVMTPTAAITGQVIGENGEPSGYAHVQALKVVYKDGRRTLTVMQLVQADERGIYRLFWLPPGEYVVGAKPLDLRRSSEMMHIPPPSRFGSYAQQMRPTVTAVNTSRMLDDGRIAEGQYVPIYFPGTRDERRATAIGITAGQTRSDVNISLAESLVRTHRIRGRVIDGTTGLPTAASLQIIPRDAPAILLIPTGEAAADGVFDMWGALPGRDYLVANAGARTGMLPVDINGGDVNGAVVTVWPGTTIVGRIRVEGATAADDDAAAGVSVTLRRAPAVNGMPDPAGMGPLRAMRITSDGRIEPGAAPAGPNTSGADGTFTLTGVPPGEYAVTVSLRNDSYLESIRLGALDVLTSGLRVDGPVKGQLDITIGARGGVVTGTVLNGRREPTFNATVVAIPESTLRERNDLYKVAATDETGQFRLRGLAPGTYQLLAWDHIERGAWHDPDVLRSEAGRGQTIQVVDGTKSHVELVLIEATP